MTWDLVSCCTVLALSRLVLGTDEIGLTWYPSPSSDGTQFRKKISLVWLPTIISQIAHVVTLWLINLGWLRFYIIKSRFMGTWDCCLSMLVILHVVVSTKISVGSLRSCSFQLGDLS